MNKARKHSRRVAQAVLWGGLGGISFLTLAVGAPYVENHYFPVVKDVRFYLEALDEDSMSLRWSGVKLRKSCALQNVAALVLLNNEWVLADMTYMGTSVPLALQRRPPGAQSFKPITLVPAGTAVKMELIYDCHPLWESVVTLPPVELVSSAK